MDNSRFIAGFGMGRALLARLRIGVLLFLLPCLGV
jgi:hypothetical protein